jgi:hypothetical protein
MTYSKTYLVGLTSDQVHLGSRSEKLVFADRNVNWGILSGRSLTFRYAPQKRFLTAALPHSLWGRYPCSQNTTDDRLRYRF